jgi:hypothetical protein
MASQITPITPCFVDRTWSAGAEVALTCRSVLAYIASIYRQEGYLPNKPIFLRVQPETHRKLELLCSELAIPKGKIVDRAINFLYDAVRRAQAEELATTNNGGLVSALDNKEANSSWALTSYFAPSAVSR